MPAKETIVLFVHGANQSQKTEGENYRTWKDSMDKQEILPLLAGDKNREIANYHNSQDRERYFPAYKGWIPVWYGNILPEISQHSNPFEPKVLNDNRGSMLERIERAIVKKYFDEVVPFYELAVIEETGKTLYETICHKLLKNLKLATQNGEYYVLVGHSMGCAVTYNIMSHISCAIAQIPYCPIKGTLSAAYRRDVEEFARSSSQCFGLLTFGNYTGCNWAQSMNNRLLFGKSTKQIVAPHAVGKWRNFSTILSRAHYLVNNIFVDSMVEDKKKPIQRYNSASLSLH